MKLICQIWFWNISDSFEFSTFTICIWRHAKRNQQKNYIVKWHKQLFGAFCREKSACNKKTKIKKIKINHDIRVQCTQHAIILNQKKTIFKGKINFNMKKSILREDICSRNNLSHLSYEWRRNLNFPDKDGTRNLIFPSFIWIKEIVFMRISPLIEMFITNLHSSRTI